MEGGAWSRNHRGGESPSRNTWIERDKRDPLWKVELSPLLDFSWSLTADKQVGDLIPVVTPFGPLAHPTTRH